MGQRVSANDICFRTKMFLLVFAFVSEISNLNMLIDLRICEQIGTSDQIKSPVICDSLQQECSCKSLNHLCYHKQKPVKWIHEWCTAIFIRLCSNPSSWHLDMADNVVNRDAVLKQHGCISDKNAEIINERSDDDGIDLSKQSFAILFTQLSAS